MLTRTIGAGFLLVSICCNILLLTACSSSKRVGNSEQPSSSIQKKYAALLQVQTNDITNKTLYTFIDKWLNTKYQYGAQQNTGIDCSGFTQLLYDAVYKKKLARNSQAQYDASKHIESKKKLEEGDLVFFTTVKGKKISHVGVYLQNDRFINATSKGVVISDMNLKYWADRFVSGGKF
jgi:murein DD-endopeptidase / murein LD-carboxypeptidase